MSRQSKSSRKPVQVHVNAKGEEVQPSLFDQPRASPTVAAAKAGARPPSASKVKASASSSVMLQSSRFLAIKALAPIVKPGQVIRVSSPAKQSVAFEVGSREGCRAKLTLLGVAGELHAPFVASADTFLKAFSGLKSDVALRLSGQTYSLLDSATGASHALGEAQTAIGSEGLIDGGLLAGETVKVPSLVAEWAFTYAAYAGDAKSVHVVGRAVAGIGGSVMHVAQMEPACPGPAAGFSVDGDWVQCWSRMADALANENELPVVFTHRTDTLRVSWSTAHALFACDAHVSHGVDFTKLYPRSGTAIAIDPAITMALESMTDEAVLFRFLPNKVQLIGSDRKVAHEVLAIRSDSLGEFAIGVNRRSFLAAIDVPEAAVSFVPGLGEQHLLPFTVTQGGPVRRQAVLMPVKDMGHAAHPAAPVMAPSGTLRAVGPSASARQSRKATAAMAAEVEKLRLENQALRSAQMELFAFKPVRK